MVAYNHDIELLRWCPDIAMVDPPVRQSCQMLRNLFEAVVLVKFFLFFLLSHLVKIAKLERLLHSFCAGVLSDDVVHDLRVLFDLVFRNLGPRWIILLINGETHSRVAHPLLFNLVIIGSCIVAALLFVKLVLRCLLCHGYGYR